MSVIDSPWALPQSAASTQPYVLRSGHRVQLWCPAPSEPHLRAWYEPAAELCQAIRTETIWRPRLEDCWFVGRVEAKRGPVLWLYRHERAGGEVLVDIHGQAYAARDDRRRKLGYRFEPIEPSGAVFQLGLHRVDLDEGARVLPFRPRR